MCSFVGLLSYLFPHDAVSLCLGSYMLMSLQLLLAASGVRLLQVRSTIACNWLVVLKISICFL